MELKAFRTLWAESPYKNICKLQRRFGLKKATAFDNHIWCLSTGRVGTATIAALANTDSEICSAHEPLPHLFGLGFQAYKHADEAFNEVIAESVATCRRDMFGMDQTTYLESSPHVTFLAPHLLKVFPNSRFIHVVRHPADVVRSGMNRRWYDGNATDQWRIHPLPGAQYFDDWNKWGAFEKNAWSWYETNRWINSFLSLINSEKYLVIKSEKLFSGDELTIKQFFDFCGSDKVNTPKIERILNRKLNSNSVSEFSSLADWDSQHMHVLELIAGDLMGTFGYIPVADN